MEQGEQFSHLVYEYFYLRLRFGYYRQGDFLPPVDTFCREFCVSGQTVKAALRRLRDEGYIDMGRGRLTRVVFHQSPQEIQGFIADYFSKRRSAFEDLYTSAGLLFAPLLTQGLRRMGKEELNALSLLAERGGEADLLHFYCALMQKLDNPLAMNFFWEASLFQGLPFARWEHRPTRYRASDVRARMRTLLSIAREGRWDAVQEALIQYRRTDLARITAYLESQIRPCAEELPFVWRIYRDRPQIYCALASRLLHEIYVGQYQSQAYLPPYAELAGTYGVSLNTIRRTVGILNRLGAVATVNGAGTRIFSLGRRCNPPDLKDPIIRQNLALFLQAFELVRYTCEGVTRALLADLAPEDRQALTARLEQDLHTGRCGVALWHVLHAAATRSRLQVVRAFYATVYGLFLWGYPLRGSLARPTSLDRSSAAFAEELVRQLQAADASRCAAAVHRFVEEQFTLAETYLLSQGLRPEELRLSRAPRFLAADSGAAPPPLP